MGQFCYVPLLRKDLLDLGGQLMAYFQDVVAEYLWADRGMFVNPEILLQLDPGASPKKGRYWYCDLLAISLREKSVFLCEVTYSSSVAALIGRLYSWQTHWLDLRLALQRDCGVDAEWSVSPWVFLPESRQLTYEQKLAKRVPPSAGGMPMPRLTLLENVLPWKYCTWDRQPSRDDA